MPENSANLASLIIGALDDFAHIKELQTLLKIGLRQAESPANEEACERLALLVDVYLCQFEPWLEEVQLGLERRRKQIKLSKEEE